MNETHNQKLKHNAQDLRKNMTDAEKRLWYDFLKKLPITVNRQKVIGEYIADFYCTSAKLVIELDGSQHYQAKKERDKVRDAYFQSMGITVLRYSNRDIHENFAGVCADIFHRLPLEGKLLRSR